MVIICSLIFGQFCWSAEQHTSMSRQQMSHIGVHEFISHG